MCDEKEHARCSAATERENELATRILVLEDQLNKANAALAVPQAVPDSAPVKLLEDIERIASYPLSGTSLQQKAQRFDLIRDKARAALALTRPK
jgi:hypothetical protein